MTELEKYESLVNVIVTRLSINKDHARERLEVLKLKGIYDPNDHVHSCSLISQDPFLSSGNIELLNK